MATYRLGYARHLTVRWFNSLDCEIAQVTCFNEHDRAIALETPQWAALRTLAFPVQTSARGGTMAWIIVSDDDAEMCWSNTDGWTAENYDTFSDDEKETLDLPIGGHWVQVPWRV